jgi:hypothetical protein
VAVATLGAAILAYLALAIGYLTLTPPWQNPDEPAHVNYVAFVAQTASLPVLQTGDWDSALLERLKNGTLQPGDSIQTIRYESWQPPLFYLLAAPIYRLGNSDTAIYRLRATDVVLGVATLLAAFLVGRELFVDPRTAAAVPLAMVGVPMFTAVTSGVSADPLATLLAAAILLVLVKRLMSPAARANDARWPLAIGLLTGLGLLTKLELAIFVPLAIGVIVVKSNAPLRESAIALLATAVVMLPWLVHQVTSYGWGDPLAIGRHSAVVQDQPRFPGFSLDWLSQFLTTSFHSFWAQFGWMAIVAPARLYLIWGAFTLVAAVGLLLNRDWLHKPAWQLMLATIGMAFLAYVGYNLSFVQFQARYLFTALVPISALLVGGLASLVPMRSQPWSLMVLLAALVALNAYTLSRVLVPGFAPSL